MVIVTGLGSTIVDQLKFMLPDETFYRAPYSQFHFDCDTILKHVHAGLLYTADRFVFAAGVLYSKRITEQKHKEIEHSLQVNLISVVQMIEKIIENNKKARICVVGSESGIKGSYDTTYALCKAAIHNYVRTKRLRYPQQQLVCVAPSIIEDSGMTQRRCDLEEVKLKALEYPKERLLKSIEVAKLIKYLLYEDDGYITNEVISIDGGKRATA